MRRNKNHHSIVATVRVNECALATLGRYFEKQQVVIGSVSQLLREIVGGFEKLVVKEYPELRVKSIDEALTVLKRMGFTNTIEQNQSRLAEGLKLESLTETLTEVVTGEEQQTQKMVEQKEETVGLDASVIEALNRFYQN